MVRLYYISGILFTIGNVVWPYFGDYRVFFIPLALFLFMGAWCVKKRPQREVTKIDDLFLEYIVLLAAGNIVKQVFYNNHTIKQVNDYVWGSLLTIILLSRILWEIRKQRSGMK